MTHDAHVQVWRTPNHLVREFAPFALHRTYTGHHDEVLSIRWAPDSTCVSFYLSSPPYHVVQLNVHSKVLYHDVPGYDSEVIHSEPGRRFPPENVCRPPRRSHWGLLFF